VCRRSEFSEVIYRRSEFSLNNNLGACQRGANFIDRIMVASFIDRITDAISFIQCWTR